MTWWHMVAALCDRSGIEGEPHSAAASIVVVGYNGEVSGASVLGELQLCCRGSAPSARFFVM